MVTFLAADIGGTKSELALFQSSDPGYTPLFQKRYASGDYSGLPDIIAAFLSESKSTPLYASVGVAGIVNGRVAQFTNLPWRIDCCHLEQQFGFNKVVLVNDLTALSSAISLLQPDDLYELRQGKAVVGEMKGVLAPGTGLGQGFLLESCDHFFARGSEGGHVDFGPVDEEQVALLCWMQKKTKPVSYEMLIAGPAIADLYDFCREYHKMDESPEISELIRGQGDRTPVIVSGAVACEPCPLCRKTIDLFLSILGSEAGNLALKLYARGGIYIGGGIVPRFVGKVSFSGFNRSFLKKGPMSELMKEIPVQLILKKDAPLLGTARIGELLWQS